MDETYRPEARHTRGDIPPEQLAVGWNGCDRIADAENHPNLRYGAVQAHGDVVIAALEGDNITGFVNHTLPSGMSIWGKITRIELTSGVLVCYNR